ncbi:hypothetical protein [Methylobacterium durans]|uniref:Uncharacterized protein n=1 Tax=Methylobacterium durans TaxID=2202825 RepID=A0A2U8WEP0_9HYPH|nr:hypothetical protein [Methylobacterium durans]AWN43806.1 hypothetical protein DK389_28915 [Methylobacterium durans]
MPFKDIGTTKRKAMPRQRILRIWEAEAIGVPADCPNTTQAVCDVDADAAALADAARLVAQVRRFISDEGHAEPRAPRLRIVANPTPRPGIFARTMAALGRPAASEDCDARRSA